MNHQIGLLIFMRVITGKSAPTQNLSMLQLPHSKKSKTEKSLLTIKMNDKRRKELGQQPIKSWN